MTPELVGRTVFFEIEEPRAGGVQSTLKQGLFLCFGVAAATDEGSYSKQTGSFSCALIEDDEGYVHSLPLDKFRFTVERDSSQGLQT